MRFINKLNIKSKIVAVIMSVTLVGMIIGFSTILFYNINSIKKQLVEQAKVTAKVVGENSETALIFNYKENADDVLKSLVGISEFREAILFDENLNVFTKFSTNEEKLVVPTPSRNEEVKFIDEHLSIFLPLTYKEKFVGVVYIHFDTNLYGKIKEQIYILLSTLIVVFFLAYILANYLQKLISRPILKLSSAAEELVHSDNLALNFNNVWEDEVGKLIDNFGIMLNHLSVRKKERDEARQKLEQLNKQLENLVNKKTLQLKNAYNDLKEFTYIVSHDLKTPLRGIHQPATWLLNDYDEVLDDQGKEFLELIIGRVNKMDKLINGVLQFLNSSSSERKAENVNIQKLVDGLIKNYDLKENIQITIPDELPTIVADKIRMERIFQNLIDNSIEFMDKEKGEIRICFSESKTHWQFCVEDNGPGIDKKYHSKIFELFQSLESSEQDDRIGVGLAIVKKIVDVYGGDVKVQSNIGTGTRIEFSIIKNTIDTEPKN